MQEAMREMKKSYRNSESRMNFEDTSGTVRVEL